MSRECFQCDICEGHYGFDKVGAAFYERYDGTVMRVVDNPEMYRIADIHYCKSCNEDIELKELN